MVLFMDFIIKFNELTNFLKNNVLFCDLYKKFISPFQYLVFTFSYMMIILSY